MHSRRSAGYRDSTNGANEAVHSCGVREVRAASSTPRRRLLGAREGLELTPDGIEKPHESKDGVGEDVRRRERRESDIVDDGSAPARCSRPRSLSFSQYSQDLSQPIRGTSVSDESLHARRLARRNDFSILAVCEGHLPLMALDVLTLRLLWALNIVHYRPR